MTFLQPFAVWFLAGLPLIVLLYFLRLKRRPVTVSTHLFWQRVINEHSRRAFFQRLRHLLSLLLHLLIFALIVGALARPLFDGRIQSGTSTVILLDARARMQAVEPDGRTRFEKALVAAREYARQGGGGREFALVTLDANASVTVPFTADEKLLRDALEKATPTDSTGDIRKAIALADSLLASRSGTRRIVLVSDRVPGLGDRAASRSALLTPHLVGTPRDNLAITRFATRPVPSNPATSEVLLEVRNFSDKPATTEIELTFDGRPIEVKPFTLAAGERRQEIFASVTRPARSARGWLVARITASDALALDNVAYATLPPARPARVLLITRGNPFIEKFLSVDPSLKFELLAPEAWSPVLAQKFEVVIFEGTLPASLDLATIEQVGGNYLFLKSTPFPSATMLDQPLITEVDTAHPVTRLAAVQNITIGKAAALAVPVRDGWKFSAPLRSFDHSLIIAGERAQQRIVAVAFDMLESDLPLRVAFPLLMSSSIQWLAGSPPDAARAVLSGEPLTLTADERVASEPVTVPPKVAPVPNVAGFFQPTRNGYYALSGEPVRWLAVNTFNEAESDLRSAAQEDAPQAGWTPAPRLTALSPWQWLALAAFALFTGEWWLFHRRQTE
jgi:Aerotolerance regulator N-terminal/von Willebrand factor type A domain